jgi:asparagine synthase (glutamine-hydrolysing)
MEDSELPSLIYEVLRKQPLPFGDSSVVPSFALAKYAKKFVKVLISGDGADEILSGYEYYRKYGNETRDSVKLYLEYLRLRFEVQAKLKLYGRKDYSRISRIRELEFILSIKSALELWHEDIAVLDTKELKLLGFSKGDSRKTSRQQYSEFRGIQSVMCWDRASYLPGDILWKSDTAGMMASLEIRTPFLNSEVVHFASQIKFTKDFSKQTFLQGEYRDQIPDEFFTRRKKGFGAPLSKWLALPEVNDLYMDFVENRKSKIYEYLNFETLSKASQINFQTKWNMLALAVWLDKNG